ncbi:hypothetical protein Asppvi_005813 [Aspergillus pseudoviridinutans]|uniref:Ricin B lectin domain-containing protein n=1 Tax=Aspergillus pseudoviridinutans TaxID=1517512 RepID=A0A9P3B9X9_9EURO|nr:uncharacterized protein Asppvi_005813 [Aspergillus pseudoviridinutans]GIJ86915.1 hypothetical protein Asppvi_005813 [Aspergillus pseudoviridinutans]
MSGPIQSDAVYRLTPKSASGLRLELSNGDPGNGTQAQGWSEMHDHAFYNQVWLLTKDPQGWWRFVNLRSGSRSIASQSLRAAGEVETDNSDLKLASLDLAGSSSANGTKIQGWATLDNDHQKWFITDAGSGYWK